jgi:bifunctional N-acetylglucosamine-1-phosphate-uridyltransferase/glucosamine-1-phosphate-acetyltransferase GlmU-like protein
VAKEAKIGENNIIGPFAYLRPGTLLGKGVKVGDFVEVKNSQIGDGSKIPIELYRRFHFGQKRQYWSRHNYLQL